MKHITVIQHTQAEWLGNIEDHFEGRGIRFSYVRPFSTGGQVPDFKMVGDGLILLSGGPWGAAGGPRQLPSLEQELRLARACLMTNTPLLGFGLGATVLALAGDGSAKAKPVHAYVRDAVRRQSAALGGFLPERFPLACYQRDQAVVPDYADILAVDEAGDVAAFSLGPRAFGFAGHPGVRRAMFEDLVMEFDDAPDSIAEALDQLGRRSREIEDALVPIMAGLIGAFGWMDAGV